MKLRELRVGDVFRYVNYRAVENTYTVLYKHASYTMRIVHNQTGLTYTIVNKERLLADVELVSRKYDEPCPRCSCCGDRRVLVSHLKPGQKFVHFGVVLTAVKKGETTLGLNEENYRLVEIENTVALCD